MQPLAIVAVLIVICLALIFVVNLTSKRPNTNTNLRLAAANTDLAQGICYQRYFSNVDPGIAGDMAANTNWTQIKAKRDDLTLFENMNVDTLRLYEWNYTVPHNVFINDVCARGLQFMLPISNYVMGWQGGPYDVRNFYASALREVTSDNAYKPCVHSIAISNEPFISFGENSLPDIERAINDILAVERQQNITQNLPPITVPVSFGNIADEGPAIYYARKINELPAVQALGDRFILSINTTNTADSIKNEFADVYQKPFYITEWGLSPQNYAEGQYAENLQRETQKLLNYAQDGAIDLRGLFGFIYFKQVWKSGAELNFGFTCFANYPNVTQCLQNNNCPPHGAQLGVYPHNSLLALAQAYGGNINGVSFEECASLNIIR